MATSLLIPLRWFADQGCTFVLVHPRSKQPLRTGWPDHPIPIERALCHVRRGGNLGILLGAPSHNVVCLDLDAHFPLVCDLYPELAHVRITRPDAPDRGKLLLRLDAPLIPPLATRKWAFSDMASPTVELLVHRAQALIPPSIHPAGRAYELHCTAPTIPTCSPPLLESVWEVLTADTFAWYNQPHSIGYPGTPITHLPAQAPQVYVDMAAIRSALYDRFPSALAVFQHFGRVGKIQPVGRNDIRLLGNGGLIVGNPRTPVGWRWYCFSDNVGGDVVDAVGYCLMGKAWNRQDTQKWQYLH